MALCAAHACGTWRQRVLVSLLSIVVLCLLDSETDGFVRQLLIRPPAVIDKKETWRRSPLNTATYGNFSLTLTRSLEVPTPSYVQMLRQGTLSVTSFSLLRRGSIVEYNLNGLRSPLVINGEYLWPNELSDYRDKNGFRVLLVPDGFLMPGQSDGAIYAIRDPDNPNSVPVRITAQKKGWFYHRAVHVKLPGGVEGILTARARKTLLGRGEGELVWLAVPVGFQMHHYPAKRSVPATSLSDSSTSATGHQSVIEDACPSPPWVETVLVEGPDVMFELLDLDKDDDRIEVVAAHFFGRKLSIHSIRSTPSAPYVEVVHSSSVDTGGRPYGLCLARMTADGDASPSELSDWDEEILFNCRDVKRSTSVSKVNKYKQRQQKQLTSMKSSSAGTTASSSSSSLDTSLPTHLLVTTHECSYDVPSAVNMLFSTMGGIYPRVRTAGHRRHARDDELEKGSSEMQQLAEVSLGGEEQLRGGTLFAYSIPSIVRSSTVKYRSRIKSGRSLPRSSEFVGGGDDDGGGSTAVLPIPLDVPETSSAVALNTIVVDRAVSGPPAQIALWSRRALCTGFRVRGWGGIFAPGAPGFPYVFRMPSRPQSPPMILIAGDCTGSAYIFAPKHWKREVQMEESYQESNYVRTHYNSAIASIAFGDSSLVGTELPAYELLFEIEVGATVGSAALSIVTDGSGDVILYVPAYELNRIHVYRLSEKTS